MYGDLILTYPKPYSVYLRGTIRVHGGFGYGFRTAPPTVTLPLATVPLLLLFIIVLPGTLVAVSYLQHYFVWS